MKKYKEWYILTKEEKDGKWWCAVAGKNTKGQISQFLKYEKSGKKTKEVAITTCEKFIDKKLC